MVLDEFGGTAGLVTLKDIINEIIGDELDTHPNVAPAVQALDRHIFLVDAQLDLEELNDLLTLELPYTDDYQTLSGFLLYQWQRIPQAGEILSFEGLTFQVVAVDGPRLQQVKITRNPSDIEAIAELDFLTEPENHPDVEEILGPGPQSIDEGE
jgi:CBS domain containing-hemolysin-like protein